MAVQYAGKKFTKVIKDTLKKEGRMAVYRTEDDDIYVMTGPYAVKFPVFLYRILLQPIVCRDMPEKESGFWVGANADGPASNSCVTVFENAKKEALKPATATDYFIDANEKLARIIAFREGPGYDAESMLIDEKFLGLFASSPHDIRMWCARRYSPAYIEDGCIEAVICPIRMDEREAERIEALAASYYQVKSEVA